jgi:hypothetical protein
LTSDLKEQSPTVEKIANKRLRLKVAVWLKRLILCLAGIAVSVVVIVAAKVAFGTEFDDVVAFTTAGIVGSVAVVVWHYF